MKSALYLAFGLLHVCSLQTGAQEILRYGAVEIGAGGVKAVLMVPGEKETSDWRVTERKPKDYDEKLESIPLGLVAADFSDAVVEDVIRTSVLMLSNMAKDPATKRRFVVVSSGVVSQAARLNRQGALRRIEEQIHAKAGVRVDRISVSQEVEFALADLTNTAVDRKSALLIDIGSGNTKFGAYAKDAFLYGEIPRGIGSERKRFENIKPGDGLRDQIALLTTTASDELRVQRHAAGLDQYRPKTVFVLGGAFFSLAGYTQPGDMEAPTLTDPVIRFVSIKSPSLKQYRRWVEAGSADLPDLNHLSPNHRIRAEKRSELSRKVIGIEQRAASLGLIDAVFSTFELERLADADSVLFPTEGQFAWLRGYVRHQLNSK